MDGLQASGALEVSGRAAPPQRGSLWSLIAGVTGLSLLIGLGRLFARYILGRRSQGTVRLHGDSLTLQVETRMAGRPLSSSEQTFARPQVASARLETRFPALPTLVGMLGLGTGVILGLIWLLDGIQGEFTPWILGGVGALMAGVLLDLGLSSLAASLPGQVTLVLYLPGDEQLRLVGCDPQRAQALIQQLHPS
jgi:hypothetical protein